MSDRCWLKINLLAAQRPLWKPIFGDPRDEPDGKTVEIEEPDANYALYEERLQLAEAGCTFYGEHDEGKEYKATIFGAIGGTHAEVPLADGRPCVYLNPETGRAVGLKKTKEALKTINAAKAVVDAQRGRKPK